MQTRKIPFKNQSVPPSIIRGALYTCYENICFSTFPYLKYKLTSSEKTLQQYNSGNCIALSTFLKKYLWNNYRIHSYIVPASVPSIFRVEGTPVLCHVALLIPLTKTSYAVVDPAFYFLDPMIVSFTKEDPKKISSMNIHNKTREDIYYVGGEHIECYFTPDDPWNYHPIEVLNPDESIGCHFIRQKPQAFLCKTQVLSNGDVYKKYHLKEENNQLVVIKDHEEVFRGTQMPPELRRELQIYLFKYFKA
jgi:hypothetical protein